MKKKNYEGKKKKPSNNHHEASVTKRRNLLPLNFSACSQFSSLFSQISINPRTDEISSVILNLVRKIDPFSFDFLTCVLFLYLEFLLDSYWSIKS